MSEHWNWRPITTAPKDGSEILVAMPGAHSDHFYVVYWDGERWASRFDNGPSISEERILACFKRPSWVELDDPPGSLCRDDWTQTPEEHAWSERAKTLWK